MAHELEIAADGSASFAYSAKIGSAWHKLGTPMEGLSDIDSILAASRADYVVHKAPLYAVDPISSDNPGLATGKFITWREHVESGPDGVPSVISRQVLGIVGDDYRTIQNRRVVELGLHLIGLAPDAEAIDCAGVLNDGRRFFVTIPLPDVVIDPAGIADVHGRNLVVVTGHDATQSLEVVNGFTRAVCANTVAAALRGSQHKIKIRHIGNTDEPIAVAKSQLGLMLTASQEFEKIAYEMLGRDCKWDLVERIAEKVWPRPEQPNERQTANHDKRIEALHVIWDSPRGAGGVGENQYAAFNVFTEYMEHQQHIVGKDTAENRAERAVDSPGFGSRVHELAAALQSGQPLRAIAARKRAAAK